MSETEPVVLDASAALAVLRDEIGGDFVLSWFPRHISTVNLHETIKGLIVREVEQGEMRAAVKRLRLTIHDCTEVDAWTAALMEPATRHLGLSLGDRTCLALGVRLGLPVLTADRAWEGVVVEGVEVRLLRG